MLLVIKNNQIFATHGDAQAITLAHYPQADRIIRVSDYLGSFPGDVDPTLADPTLCLEVLADRNAPAPFFAYVHCVITGGKMGKTCRKCHVNDPAGLHFVFSVTDAAGNILPISGEYGIAIFGKFDHVQKMEREIILNNGIGEITAAGVPDNTYFIDGATFDSETLPDGTVVRFIIPDAIVFTFYA